ncbi:MAG: pantoate--beta-alanine ligase [Phycisphaerae bacterium]
MEVEKTIDAIRSRVRDARRAGRTIGLVPTMGALHTGHYSLIRTAREGCDYLVVSIFVNPTQFGPGEDYANYPRSMDEDLAGCENCGVDAVFAPGVEDMYPEKPLTTVSVSRLTETLCGSRRPGHFDGVCTVVAKLFNIVQPDRAWFGTKDYQQLVVVRRMSEDLNFPVEVLSCPTVREQDGLAVSSRNAYLTSDERRQAPALYAALQDARRIVEQKHPSAEEVIDVLRRRISADAPDGKLDYAQVVDPHTLKDVEETDRPVVIAAALYLGKARLIDNVRVD